MPPPVVSNASPLIAVEQIGHLLVALSRNPVSGPQDSVNTYTEST